MNTEPTPSLLVLKLRTVEPLPKPRLFLDELDEPVSSFFIVTVTMAYDAQIAAQKQYALISLNLHGIIKECVLLSVEPAGPDAKLGVDVKMYTPKVPPVPEPAPAAAPVFRPAVEWGQRLPISSHNMRAAFPEFVFCSSN